MSRNTGKTVTRFRFDGIFGRIFANPASVRRAFFVASMLALCLIPAALHSSVAAADASCSGEQVQPSSDLSTVAENYPGGTTYCLQDGTFTVLRSVKVQSGDKFIGVYSDSSRPEVTTSIAHSVFDTGGSDGALVRSLRVSGAVGDNTCEPDCGRGIGSGGTNLTVSDVVATGNANQGIGGTGVGLLVENSEITDNGSYSFSRDGGPVSAAGIKSVNSLTVVNSVVQDNYWTGIWCDQNCGSFRVKQSTILRNGKVGIHDEISRGPAIFSDNIIKDNGTLAQANRHSGLLIVSSSGATIKRNRLNDNVSHGIEVVEDARAPKVKRVYVSKNRVRDDGVVGCKISGVECRRNR